VSDLKAKIMEQAESAFAYAKADKNTDGMTRATEMLLRIWLEEASRYAQVPAAVDYSAGTSASYSDTKVADWDGTCLTAGQCTCGAEELPRPSDEARAKALAATLNPKDEAVGVQTLIGIDLG
jgi:hypothetical protein